MHRSGQKLKILPLERILASKRAAKRAKDRIVIPVLEDAMAVAETLKKAKRGKRRNRRSEQLPRSAFWLVSQ